MNLKQKFPRAAALAAAKELCDAIKPHCERLIVAGSLRRRKEFVGDVEILFIPKFIEKKDGLFDIIVEDCVAGKLEELLARNVITKRRTIMGSETWGAKNKLAVHITSGIPVDFFTATPENWFNYLVCRTGGAENNIIIAAAAKVMGWHWNPYGPGFTDREGNTVPVTSELDVFRFTGQNWREPWERP